MALILLLTDAKGKQHVTNLQLIVLYIYKLELFIFKLIC